MEESDIRYRSEYARHDFQGLSALVLEDLPSIRSDEQYIDSDWLVINRPRQ